MKFIFGKEFNNNYILNAIEIDEKYYHSSQIVSMNQCLNWSQKNEYIYAGAIEEKTGKLLGYLNLMPVEDEVLDDVLLSEFNDINLSSSKILSPLNSNNSSLYFASAGINSIGSDEVYAGFMYRLLYEFLLYHARRNVYFKKILAEVFTEDGKKYAQNLGFKLLCEKKNSFGVYQIDLLENKLNFIFENCLELEKLYYDYHS